MRPFALRIILLRFGAIFKKQKIIPAAEKSSMASVRERLAG
jgi:hypothetical protein